MAVKSKYVTNGQHVAHNLVSSASESEVYSDPFGVTFCEVWNTQFVWADDAADFACTITLWASNLPSPDLSSDGDWVQMVSGHGYTGLPGGNPAAGSGKDMVDISPSGALWYRWKFERTAGSGVIQAYSINKDRK